LVLWPFATDVLWFNDNVFIILLFYLQILIYYKYNKLLLQLYITSVVSFNLRVVFLVALFTFSLPVNHIVSELSRLIFSFLLHYHFFFTISFCDCVHKLRTFQISSCLTWKQQRRRVHLKILNTIIKSIPQVN